MKDKFNRVVATGLLALMIANFSACDEASLNNPDLGSNTTATTQSQDNKFASGSVWEAMKAKSVIDVDEYPYGSKSFDGKPIPSTFLIEEGILTRDHLDRLCLVHKPEIDLYEPIRCYVFVDNKSNENDIYLLLQYQDEIAVEGRDNSNVHLTTWQLKYTLDDDDYQTFLKLKGDWRIRLFIQEMDKQYQPEVISKATISYELLSVGSHVRDKRWDEQSFPNIFVTNIDYDNQILTFGSRCSEGIKYIDVNMREVDMWDMVVTRDGWSEEKRENSIDMFTKPTPAGDCLIRFHIGTIKAVLKVEQAKEAFDNTTNISKLSQIDINTMSAKYDYYDEMAK